MIEEKWKPIAGYEDFYEVSSLGNIRSVTRVMSNGKTLKSKILKPYANKNTQHLQIMLHKGDSHKMHYVRRLVAAAFVENPHSYSVVKHIDGDKNNNKSDNLAWVENNVSKVN